MTSLSLPADERSHTPLWRNISFLLMWSSVAASGFSDRIIQLAALPMLGVNQADAQAAAITAGITFFFFLPYLFVMLPAGWLADRLPRKWIMLGCDEGRAAVLLLAFTLVPAGAAAAIPADQHWKVYAIIAATGALAAVFNPARNATIPQIVPFSQLQRANALTFAIAVIASLVGLLVGTEIIARWSLAAALLVAVLAYSISGTFFAFIKPVCRQRLPQVEAAPRRLGEGWFYLIHHRRIVQLVVIDAVMWGAANLVFAALAALCKERYGFVEPDAFLRNFGRISAAAGAGMLASAIIVGWMNFRRESTWFLLLSLASAGTCVLGLAVSSSYGLGLLFTFGTGFFGNAAIVCAGTLLQSISPNYIRGRVFAVNSLVSTVSAVGINFVIWQTPAADDWMIWGLIAVAVVLILGGLWGGVRELTHGPFTMASQNILWRLIRLFMLVWHRLRWVGKHHIPAEGPVILASNHTTGLDPLLMQAASRRVIRWVMLTSYHFRIAAPVWRAIEPITLDRDTSDLGKLRQVVQTLRQGEVVGLFPEGGLQRTQRQLQPFQPGVAMIAQRARAWIVPVWIDGTPRRQNMVWQFLQPSRCTVAFGEPFQPAADQSHEEILDELRRRMLALAASISAADQPEPDARMSRV